MKKKLLSAVVLSLVAITIAGCGNLQKSSLSSGNGSSKKEKVVQTTSSNDGSSYNTLLQGKQYQVSPINGLTSGDNDNQFNLQSFDAGLLEVSKKEFATKEYTFQEGNVIKSNVAQNWLARKSDSNKEGLNPADNGKTDPKERNPLYLSQIIEDDFYKESGNSYQLSGISIGLSMNEVDYYTKVKYGATFETKISEADRVAEGKKMADEIVKRLRKMKKTKDIPIMVALYKAETKDSLVGGNYFMYGVSKNGTSNIGSWSSLNNQSQVLPVVNNAKVVNTADSDAFSSFKSHIQNYFPKLSGVIGKAHYADGNLDSMSITITTQFYGAAEVKSFTQYVSNAASSYLPGGVDLEIKIQSTNGLQAFVAREKGQKDFYSHVFNDY